MTDLVTSDVELTGAQRRIVEWGEGPLVVIAGAGTGKTRVIVERVRWLLKAKGAVAVGTHGELLPSEPQEQTVDADLFAGPLLPEQLLVLTYNVKAAKELSDRIEAAVGPAARARLSVSNFHSFCHRILTESAADAGLPAQPDVLDGIGQVLLLRDIRPNLPLVYYAGGSNPNYWLDQFVAFINRAKDELVTPDGFDVFVERERRAFEDRYESYQRALERVEAQGNLAPLREVRKAYADFRRAERAAEAGDETASAEMTAVERTADREARRTISGDGRALTRGQFSPDDHPRIDVLADSYVADGAALEVLRLSELALVYRAYQDELATRGALDFGEQISLVTRLFKRKPNVLRRYQRQFRYILVDEFQDANIAQIELIELLGRTPDRPDNVVVVGDDDQSIYRFRGASYAAFVEFDRRFSGPPAYDPTAPAPGTPPRLRIEENFRSVENVLAVGNRLIERNQLRYAPEKTLAATRSVGDPVELVVCTDTEDEARQIVDRIKAWTGWDPSDESSDQPIWSDYAVLYRKHRHREAIIARLREEAIPYTVVGGLSLFETPEIRDLEQSLRAIADPLQDVALVRMMSAAPWRLDALEILQVARMAKYDNRHLIEVIRDVVESGEMEVDRVRPSDEEVSPEPGAFPFATDSEEGGASGLALQPPPTDLTMPTEGTPAPPTPRETRRIHVAAPTRAKLRRLLRLLEELAAKTWRDGPFTVVEEYVVRTGVVFDLVALDTLDAKRTVANIANFMRFAHDWQAEHSRGTLAGFVDYLDAYQSAGGELPTSVEASDDTVGVQLMTLYQAKGLEFNNVFIPQLLKDEWPAREYGSGLFPKDLLKESVPVGDIHTEEERRLLYVALTRARDRVVATTIAGPGAQKDPSPFLDDLREGAGAELTVTDRTIRPSTADEAEVGEDTNDSADDAGPVGTADVVARVLPPPTARERRLSLRVRANELLELLEGIERDDPEAEGARESLAAEFGALAARALESADDARAHRLDPLTLRVVALDTGAGANLLEVAALPATFSYSQVDSFERCPLQYAFRNLYRIPSSRIAGALTFGSSAHAAFETFTRERRERLSRGEPPPTRADLGRLFEAEWKAGEFEEKTAEENYRRRVRTLLDNFWDGELSSVGQAEAEERPFELVLEVPDGEPAIFTGVIDRIDRLPSGGIEVIDYKTGRLSSQKSVQESLQLSIYALACRDALALGTPEKVTLYFTESATRMTTTRTDEQLNAARQQLVAWVARVRAGDFAATPSASVCWRCDYAPMCPSRLR